MPPWSGAGPTADPLTADRGDRRRLLARLVRITEGLRTRIALDDLSLVIPDLLRARAVIDELLLRSIASGRRRGQSWDGLGAASGTSGQALADWYARRTDGSSTDGPAPGPD